MEYLGYDINTKYIKFLFDGKKYILYFKTDLLGNINVCSLSVYEDTGAHLGLSYDSNGDRGMAFDLAKVSKKEIDNNQKDFKVISTSPNVFGTLRAVAEITKKHISDIKFKE